MGRSAEVARLMTKINNRKVISQIAATTYKANKKRNVLTIFAIILTTFLIGVVFAVGMSYWLSLIHISRMPMAAVHHSVAAVFIPRTVPLSLKITPLHKKPTPDIILLPTRNT